MQYVAIPYRYCSAGHFQLIHHICIPDLYFENMIGSVKKFVHELLGEAERDGRNLSIGQFQKKNNQGRLYGISRCRLIEEIASTISRDWLKPT